MKNVSIFLLGTLFPICATAFFVDAGQLAASARQYDRWSDQATSIDLTDVTKFTAYVQGTYDTLDLAELICKPKTLTAGQLHSIVAKHLRESPEQWHRPAAIVITEGLRKAFPCPKVR